MERRQASREPYRKDGVLPKLSASVPIGYAKPKTCDNAELRATNRKFHRAAHTVQNCLFGPAMRQ